MPRSRKALLAAVCSGAVALLLGGGASRAADEPLASIDEAGWQGILGVRPTVSTAQRHIVVLRGPSLASRVRAEGGSATEAQMRRWTSAATGAQEQFLRRISASGAQVAPEHRYARVLNAFAARLDPTSLALLDRDREVAGIFPVRIAYPAADGSPPGLPAPIPATVPGLGVPGLDGSGVVVALLDTGVDRSHPFLRDSVLPGIDVIAPGSGGIAQPHPAIPGRPERHGTELAGIVTGSDGPGGLHGIAPGASILPIRVAGWQPDAEGGYAVYSRTDQLLAGLEAAVDPNDDGDAHDAARIALVGVAEPYAAFSDGPLARAIAGATVLDTLVIVPAGNDGRAGPVFGSIAGPGGAPAALTVAAVDGRASSPTVRVNVRAGLRVLFDGALPLGGAPTQTATASLVPVARSVSSGGIAGYFSKDGTSTIAGDAVLLPRGGLSDEAVEEAASAGARSVLVDGLLPAGAFSLDVPSGVPVVGLPSELARAARALHASGIPVTVAVGAVHVAENADGGSVAAFSSRGLAFAGVLKPELLAPGVSVPTSEPGRTDEGEVRYGTLSGTSVSAAVAAGAAAVLAGARPRAGAAGLLGLLVGSARKGGDATAAWAGMLQLQTAVQQEVVVEPAAVSFGPISFGAVSRGGSLALEQIVLVRNLSPRRVTVSIRSGSGGNGVEISAVNDRLRLRAGASGEVVLRAEIGSTFTKAGVTTGELVLQVRRSTVVRLPWSIAAPAVDVDLLSQVSLRETGERISDATPAVVSFVAGAIETGTDPKVRPVDMLEVQLWRGNELRGVLSRRRELLPGRYTFGLTGRGPRGEPLRRGSYVVRLVARPGDGTRRQIESIDYVVR
jgi:subtilisin family serine protease